MRTGWWLLALLVGCRSFPALDVKSLPTAKDHPDAKYVVLLDESIARYVPEGPGGAPQVVITDRRRVKILKPTVLPSLHAWYDRAFTRIESIRGRIVKPDGTEEPLDDSKKSDHPENMSGFFTDNRVITMPVPPLPVGAVFESEIVTRYLETKPFVVRQVFGDEMPMEVARLVVTAPKDWLVRWQVQSWDSVVFAPTETVEGDVKTWTFERSKIPAAEMNQQGPDWWALFPSVAVRLEEWSQGGKKEQAFANPEVLSAWLADQYEERSAITPELERTVKEVLAGVPDEPEAKARALYEHACRSIQYCAIMIGYGGWIPHPAATVQQGRYGDCKGKATYLHTLLKVAGIPSAPTLIYSHKGTPMPFQLPSLGANFNHAILAVDLPEGRTVYADPTWRVVPFGQLPPNDQEATVLELRPGNGAPLKTTPASEAATNVEKQTLKLTLDGRGDGQGEVTFETRGASALEVKDRLLTGTGKLSEWLNKQLWNRSTNVSTAKPLASGDFVDTASVEGTVEVRHLLVRGTQGDALFRLSDVFEPWAKVWPDDRKTNVVTRFAKTFESKLIVQLPAGAEVRSVPSDEDIESVDADYHVRWKKVPGGLEVTRTLVRKKRVLQVARLAEANRFASEVLIAEHAAAVLRLPVMTEASR